MLKIFQTRIQQYMNHELPDVQAGFWRGRQTREQTANIHWIMEKAKEFQENIYFSFIDYAKPLTVWTTTNCAKFLERLEYQTTLPVSWEISMQVKKQQLEPYMKRWTGSKLGKEYKWKEYEKTVYCTLFI